MKTAMVCKRMVIGDWLLVSAAAFFLSALALVSSAFACSCMPMTSEERIAESSAIFVGKVFRSIRPTSDKTEFAYTIFTVSEMLKGEPSAAVKIVHRIDLGGNCGIDFEVGEDVFVIASSPPNKTLLFTNLCLMAGSSPDDIRAVLKRQTKSAP